MPKLLNRNFFCDFFNNKSILPMNNKEKYKKGRRYNDSHLTNTITPKLNQFVKQGAVIFPLLTEYVLCQ